MKVRVKIPLVHKTPKVINVTRKGHVDFWRMYMWPAWETYMWTIGARITLLHGLFFTIQMIVVTCALFEFKADGVVEKIGEFV